MSDVNIGINLGLEAAITFLEADENFSKKQIIEVLKSLKRKEE